MQRKKQGNVEWLEFDLLQPFSNVVHATFLRHGGMSKAPFDSFNLGEDVGDQPDNAKHHRKVIQKILGLPQLVYAKQYHSRDITEVMPVRRHKIPYCDGLMTQAPNVGLMIKHADCQAAIFYDPVHNAIANIHCGWKGNVQNIYAFTIEKMRERYGTHTKDLIVCISPSLGPEAAQFTNYENELPQEFWPFQIKPFYFDLWQISRWQLMQVGVLPQHIEIASICTHANPSDFFSYRRDRTTGRHATVIALIEL